jgi:hypothetical protein
MSRDTFLTIEHRGAHVHSYFDQGREIITTTITGNRQYSSVTVAKRAISRNITAIQANKFGPQPWVYRGVMVFPTDRYMNGSIRWYARTASGMLRADSKQMMRFAISELAVASR